MDAAHENAPDPPPPHVASPHGDLERIGSTLFEDVVRRFVVPEMSRRIELQEWAPGAGAYRFQVLWPSEGPVLVRLNEEAGGTARAKAARPVEKGQILYTEDIAGIEEYTPPPEDADTPHLTAFAHSGGWSIVFALAYRHPHRHAFLEVGRQFGIAAREALAADRGNVALDNAFSACELLAKAELLSCSPTIEAALAARSHSSVHELYNLWGRLENTDRRFVRLLNRLWELRPPARYLDRELRLRDGEPEVLLVVLAEMEEYVAGVVEGDASVAPDRYNVIATRDLTAGSLVTSKDATLRPARPKRP